MTQQTQKVKTIFDDQKTKLTAKPIESGARPPTLQTSTYRNNPQLTVFTNHDNGSGVTWINAAFDIYTWESILRDIVFLTTEACPRGEVINWDNKKDIPKEKRTDPKVTKQVASIVQIGKDEEGRIWISVQDPNKANAPKIRFYFGTNYYHATKSKMGSVTPQHQSINAALAWVKVNHDLMMVLLSNNPNAAIDAENAQAAWKDKGGNGGGYGGNKGGGYKQNSNKPAANSGDGFGGGFDDGEDWDE